MLSPRCRTSERDVRFLPRAPEVQTGVPSRGGCAHGLEAEKSAAVDAENPRELSGAASPAGWLHAPGLENGFADGGVDGSGGCGGNGVGSGSSGRGELPPGRAAHNAQG
jgi:hypothetical protein